MENITNRKEGISTKPIGLFSVKAYSLIFVFLALLLFITFILTAITLNVVVKRLNPIKPLNPSEGLKPNAFADEIKIDELMKHLKQLQIIADNNNGTRATGTKGFSDTLMYITSQLEQNTNLLIHHEYFPVPNIVVQGTPQLQSNINGTITNHIYLTDFAHVIFSPGANFDSFLPLVLIPNLGCRDADWANMLLTDSIALVKRGTCSFPQKNLLAEKYGAKGLLMYNDGTTSNRFQVSRNERSLMNATIPAMFLSYSLGMKFVNAISNSRVNISIQIKITVNDAQAVENICADTPTGDKTKTIVIGSHSDGVLDGSGINDNGSGSIGNLVLALVLSRLFQSSSLQYTSYPYRVRFCWWGAEELGLLGSIYHVRRAAMSNATIENGRLQDYLFYFNYDMLGSPNGNFGVLDSEILPVGTPSQAVPGTNRVMDIFHQWFEERKLPWSKSDMSDGSDFVPFLQSGIASGGVDTGASEVKTVAERDQYVSILGIGNGGIANAPHDSCYHQQCDRITNINPFVYEKVVKATAYAIEHLGRLNDLEKWLYPDGRVNDLESLDRNLVYDFLNERDLSENLFTT